MKQRYALKLVERCPSYSLGSLMSALEHHEAIDLEHSPGESRVYFTTDLTGQDLSNLQASLSNRPCVEYIESARAPLPERKAASL